MGQSSSLRRMSKQEQQGRRERNKRGQKIRIKASGALNVRQVLHFTVKPSVKP